MVFGAPLNSDLAEASPSSAWSTALPATHWSSSFFFGVCVCISLSRSRFALSLSLSVSLSLPLSLCTDCKKQAILCCTPPRYLVFAALGVVGGLTGAAFNALRLGGCSGPVEPWSKLLKWGFVIGIVYRSATRLYSFEPVSGSLEA